VAVAEESAFSKGIAPNFSSALSCRGSRFRSARQPGFARPIGRLSVLSRSSSVPCPEHSRSAASPRLLHTAVGKAMAGEDASPHPLRPRYPQPPCGKTRDYRLDWHLRRQADWRCAPTALASSSNAAESR